MSPAQTLKKFFGYTQFRAGQLEIINSQLENKDTLAILPTGGGKSICFQVPALMKEGVAIVISPLISLMQDQVENLNKKGINSTFLNSSLEKSEYQKRLKNFANNHYKLIYVAPERLLNSEFVSIAKQVKISLITVDEAHCISEWGNDFRPAYKKIPRFVAQLSKRPTISAFTATATSVVIDDITLSLKLDNPHIYKKSFRRTNLNLHVLQTDGRQLQEFLLMRLLKKHAGETGIIYTATRSATEYISKVVNYLSGYELAAAYHGGLQKEVRSEIQEQFMLDRKQIIVATNAFGMGVDKSNVRFVIHYHPSTSIENYYQEVGRAGRDGEKSACYLLYNPYSLKIHYGLIKKQDQEAQARNLRKLQAMIDYAQTRGCRMQFILNYFGEKAERCGSCDFCKALESDSRELTHPLLQLVTTGEKVRIQALLDLRAKLASGHRRELTEVMTDSVLCYLALNQPTSHDQLLKIPGIGVGWVEQWGKAILMHKNK